MAQFFPYTINRHALIETELITLAEAKLYLRVDHAEEDTLIANFIQAAREAAEDVIKKSLLKQQWKIVYQHQFPCKLYLPMGPVDTIVSVEAEDSSGNVSVINSGTYSLNKSDASLTFQTIVYGVSLTIIYETVDSAEQPVDEVLRQAMLGHVQALYEKRSDATLPEASRNAYMQYRKVSL